MSSRCCAGHRAATWPWRPCALALALACSLWASGAQALEARLSGFGTLGWTRSDAPWRFQKHIDGNGGLWRDSVVGGQFDLTFNPEWSATVQATLAPSLRHDRRWAVEASWAFVSWRPDNDWLLRAGKQRVPLFLQVENRDVGITYPLARLPAEVHALSPGTDMTGLSFTRAWQHGDGELSADAYAGRAQLVNRFHTRDQGALYFSVRSDLAGAVLTWRSAQLTWRAGVHRVRSVRSDGQTFPSDFPFVNLGGGQGAYQVLDALPGPGVPQTDHIVNEVLNLGFDAQVAPGWRVLGEFARNFQRRTRLGADTAGLHLALLRPMGAWTPYLGVARQQTLGPSRLLWQRINATAGQGSDRLSTAQRVASDAMLRVQDQTTLALGTAWQAGRNSVIKLEWAHSRIGERSAMVDAPPGPGVSHRGVNVITINHSFAFD